jgi:transcriptional regulator with XRE-family HTH domain
MKTPPKRSTGRPPRARARYAAASAANGQSDGQTLAVLLRQLRTERGLSTRRLAERAGMARSTVQRLERGQLRPRLSTLGWIAGALDPDRRADIYAHLVAAAGDGIAPHNEAWARYQQHRMDERLQSGRAPLPVAWERQIRLTAASDAMQSMAMALTDRAVATLGRPGTDCIGELLDLLHALDEESARLAADAGGRVVATPPQRRRGDPPDVSPFASSATDLSVVWRWMREWQVREGRIQPRSARERAIAQTGVRERQAIKDAPPPRMAEDVAIRGDDAVLDGCRPVRVIKDGTMRRRRLPHVQEQDGRSAT